MAKEAEKTFDERTAQTQPWADYQAAAEKAAAESIEAAPVEKQKAKKAKK